MSQTYSDMLAKVKEFHDKHQFSKDEYRGHDMSYRILLTIEELGELAECFTKGKSDKEKAEELADLLILIIGHSIAMDVDLEEAFDIRTFPTVLSCILTTPLFLPERIYVASPDP